MHASVEVIQAPVMRHWIDACNNCRPSRCHLTLDNQNLANLVKIGDVFFKYLPPTHTRKLLPRKFLLRTLITFIWAKVELLRSHNGPEVTLDNQYLANLVKIGDVFFKYLPPTRTRKLLPRKFLLRTLIPFIWAKVELLRSHNGPEVTLDNQYLANLVKIGDIFFKYLPPTRTRKLLPQKFLLRTLIPFIWDNVKLLRSHNSPEVTFAIFWIGWPFT